MTYYTTLNKIRDHYPCVDGWEKLLRNLRKTQADDEQLSIITILNSNGIEDAIWCLRTADGIDKDARLFAVWCARQVEHLMPDERSITALDVAERYANAEATDDDLYTARAAASAAAWAAASAAAWAAASAAASAAAIAAAWDAARDAARAAAWAAARYAASAAASAAARAAALDAAWATQEAEFRRRFGGVE